MVETHGRTEPYEVQLVMQVAHASTGMVPRTACGTDMLLRDNFLIITTCREVPQLGLDLSYTELHLVRTCFSI